MDTRAKSHFSLGGTINIFSKTFAEEDIRHPAVIHMVDNIKDTVITTGLLHGFHIFF